MKISIVIPTYQRVDFLDRLLESIVKQTYQFFEVIVIDDASPNIKEYESLVKKYKGKIKEFSYITKKKNKGAPHSRNIGIRKAKYDLIAFVDDDDEWLPNKLEKQIKIFLDSHDYIGLVYTWTYIMDENRNIIGLYNSCIEGDVKKEILKGCFIPSPSVMVRKSAIIQAGFFNEKLPSCQDWDMWTKIVMKGFQVKVLKEFLTIYHKHSKGNIGLSKNAKDGYYKYYLYHFFDTLKCFCFSESYFYVKKIIQLRIGKILGK